MKSVFYALIGVALYAVQNTIIDVKLKQYSPMGLLLEWYIFMLPLGAAAFLYLKWSGETVTMPTGNAMWLMMAVAVMFFFADYFYLKGYEGLDVVTVTSLLLLMPVIGAALKRVWVGDKITFYHVAAFACAALAVVFVALGSRK